ncbi:hypothetical protein D3C85_1704700 [compost metagenome]
MQRVPVEREEDDDASAEQRGAEQQQRPLEPAVPVGPRRQGAGPRGREALRVKAILGAPVGQRLLGNASI